MLSQTDSKSRFGMFLAMAVVVVVAPPSWANMANLADYRNDAVSWAMRVGFTSDCADATASGALEAEAEAGAELLAPGFWNWLTGATAEEKQKLFDQMWEAYLIGAAEAKATEGPATCGLRKAQLDLVSLNLSIKRERYAVK